MSVPSSIQHRLTFRELLPLVFAVLIAGTFAHAEATPPGTDLVPVELRVLSAEVTPDAISPVNRDGISDTATLTVTFAAGPVSLDSIEPLPDASPLDLIQHSRTNRHAAVRLDWVISTGDGTTVRSFHREVEYEYPLDIVELVGPGGESLPYARLTITISWDGRDDSGAWCSDGVYSDHLQADLYSWTGELHGPGPRTVVTPPGTDTLAVTDPVTGEVTVDNTPPRLVRSWPPANPFGTDLTEIEIAGTVVDALTGVDYVRLIRSAGPSISLSSPDFLHVVSLDTEFPDTQEWRDNVFTLEACDAVGNRVRQELVVRYTLGTTVTLGDPQRVAEDTHGNLLSTYRAFVKFTPAVTRQEIHEIIRDSGGRVVGFLKIGHSCMAQFETESLDELEARLSGLRSVPGVVGAFPESFPSSDAAAWHFDNDDLPSINAYANAHLPAGAHWLMDYLHDHPTRRLGPVRIAIIESGLDPLAGMDGEVANITLYDMCTPDGRAGHPALTIRTDPDTIDHGTAVASIIAGANNGHYNNGVVAGIEDGDPATDFEVILFATHCPGDPPKRRSAAALSAAYELITSGQLGAIDIVNMSYGAVYTRSQLEFLAGYVRSVHGANALWVASAGNDNKEWTCPDPVGDNTWPLLADQPSNFLLQAPAGLSCFQPNVIAVTNHESLDDARHPTSNYGSFAQLTGPGTRVHALWGPTYGFVTGTSFSAPMVAGAAALCRALDATLSPADVRKVLVSTGRPVTDPDLAYQRALDIEQLLPACMARPHTWTGKTVARETRTGIARKSRGLSGFSFDFLDPDHHLEEVRVQFAVDDDALMIAYNDKNDDDEFVWSASGTALPFDNVQASVIEEDGRGSIVTDPLPDPKGGVYALAGFHFRYTNGDHQVNRIAIHEPAASDRRVRLWYHDRNADDPFHARIDWVLVPAENVASTRCESGFSRGGAKVPIGAGSMLLTSFDLDFDPPAGQLHQNDHHIDEFSVLLDEGTLVVRFNDKNDDDLFHWRVCWMELK